MENLDASSEAVAPALKIGVGCTIRAYLLAYLHTRYTERPQAGKLV